MNTYTDNNITYTWPDKMPVSSALAGLFTRTEWAPKDPLEPGHPKYYDYHPVGQTPEELLKMKSISALDILWCNPKFAEEGAVPRIKSIPAEINTTTDLFNWIRYYDYTFKYIKLDTHCDYRTKYLTFVVTDSGDITWSGSSSDNALSYSTDDGVTWSNESDNISLSVDIGDKVLWRGTTTPFYEYGIGRFNGDNGVRYDVEGNIMSLLYGDNFKGETSLNNDYAFYQLFCANEYIVNAENLSLPATTLDDCCYGEMFYNCTNLITAPFELPATTLAGGCYEGMFYGCTSLTTAPELPATTLASGCYQSMFEGCTSLTIAPKLPATTLAPYCYNDMFFGCENLNSITCLAVYMSASDCTADWVYNVAASGTFTKASGVTWRTGTDGIPSDWSVSNYKSKIDCVKYRIFNKNFDQIGYFGNDGTDDKKLNIKSYNDLSIKSLGHINISAFNNCIKFNESELKIIGGGKRFNIDMPWGSIFSSNRDVVTISHKINSSQSLIQNAITLYSGGIKIKHNGEDKELFVDINNYMQPQNIDGQPNPVYPSMPQAYLYTYKGKPVMYHEIGANFEGEEHTVTSIRVCFTYEYQQNPSSTLTPDPLIKFYHFNKSVTDGSMTYVQTTETLEPIYKQLLTKTFIDKTDNVTENSQALVTSGGVYTALTKKADTIELTNYTVNKGTTEEPVYDSMPFAQNYTYKGKPALYFETNIDTTYEEGIPSINYVEVCFVSEEIINTGGFSDIPYIEFTVLHFNKYQSYMMFTGTTTNSFGSNKDDFKKLFTNLFINKTDNVTENSQALVTSGGVYNTLTNYVAVDKDQSQSFNENQKTQARTNIGAASTAIATTEANGLMSKEDKSTLENKVVRVDKSQTFLLDEQAQARANIGAASSSSDLIGEIKMWCSNSIPNGYLLCNGQTFDVTTYPELYKILGTNVVPDLRGRFIVGACNKYPIDKIGGEEIHKLTTDEMPSHSHQFDNIIYSESHRSVSKGRADGVYGYLTDGSLVKGRVGNIPEKGDGLPGQNSDTDYDNDTFPYMTMPTASTGGGKPHNNMPPYYALTFIIRASGGIIPDIPDYSQDYFTMTVTTGGTINFTGTGSNVLYYSKNNGTTWIEASGNIPVSANDKILWKGDTTPIEDIEENGIGTFGGDINVRYSVEGNAMSLLFGNNEEFKRKTSLEGNDYAFYDLFFGNKNITSADNLSLPATTLVDSCYVRMFYGCTNLTTAPKLPAGTLAYYCYGNMFSGCTSLMTAPKLPATTLISGCYKSMFYNCTSLTTAPELPATTLAFECYSYMFQGCENLTTVPFVLPATVLADSCYQNMFYNCTSLTIAPKLPATVLANNCYKGMFGGCRILTTAPELPATTLAQNCYDSMFRGCENLTTAPELPATTLTQECYYNMFKGCTSLNSIKCLATDISVTSGYTIDWVSNVASSGTFIKDASANWGSGTSAIPIGWNVINYSNNSSNSLDAEFEEEQTEEQSPDSEPEVNP